MNTATPSASMQIADRCVCCGSPQLSASPAVLMPFVAHRALGWAPVQIDASWGLQTLATGHAYSICNSLLCAHCELLFLDMRFSDDAMARLYHDYRGPAYTQLRTHYEPGYTQRNDRLNQGVGYLDQIERFLAPWLPAGTLQVLDWGGDTGTNTPFKQRAARFDIFDISDKPTVAGARRVTQREAESGHYHLVVCSNVLEHVPYPAALLHDMRQCTSQETVVYIEVPCEALVLAHPNPAERLRSKRHWHEHVNFFSERALRALADQAGLDVVALQILEVPDAENPARLFQLACRQKPL